MSKIAEHFVRSLENVERKYPELYLQEKETIEKLILEVHEWLDYYCGKTGEDEEGKYDFTGRSIIRHRRKRHHLEGINKAVEIFSCLYGGKFTDVIRQEARQHVIDDMGEVLFAEDYHQIGFWKKYEN